MHVGLKHSSPQRMVKESLRKAQPNTLGADRGSLAGLIPLWPTELADTSLAGRERLLAKLECALRGERQRGIGGNWTYDLARHAALARAVKAETEAVRALRSAADAAIRRQRWTRAVGPQTKNGVAQ